MEINKQLLLMQEQYMKDVEKLNEQARTNDLNQELKAIELRRAALVGGEQQTIEDTLREIEIKRQLEANEIVKLKFAKNIARDKDKYIDEIVSKTRAKLIDVRGHVAVIYKKKP